MVVLVGQFDRGAEAHLVARRLRGRIDDLCGLHDSGQMGQPAIDLPEALAAVDIVAVFGPIAVGGGPGDRLDQLGALGREQLFIFGADARETLGRDEARRERHPR